MIVIDKKANCCGCTACVSVCPQNCIKMVEDEEGFKYPVVDKDKCIDCKLCEKVCPVINSKKFEGEPLSVIARNKDEMILKDSTSGGAFTALAKVLIQEKNAIVFGACFDKDNIVRHSHCETVEELYKFRGSKFVQSDITGVYREISNYLASDRVVLFSGTPCQIAGLKRYLNGKYENNLYCIDIVCRGVPSPKLWKEYVSWIENKFQSKIVNAKFRNKTYGYHSSTMLLEFENGKKYKKSGRVDPMMRLFTKEMCSRPSCSECVFKTKKRESDLTLFDCKRYTELTDQYDDDKGYTAIFIQSNKGKEWLNKSVGLLELTDVDTNKLISKCGIMVCGRAQQNPKRSKLFEQLGNKPLDQIVFDMGLISNKDMIIESLKNILYKTGLIKIARKIKKHEDISIK